MNPAPILARQIDTERHISQDQRHSHSSHQSRHENKVHRIALGIGVVTGSSLVFDIYLLWRGPCLPRLYLHHRGNAASRQREGSNLDLSQQLCHAEPMMVST